jgi:hypothetical protein
MQGAMAGVHMFFFLFVTLIFACSEKKAQEENSSEVEINGTKI